MAKEENFRMESSPGSYEKASAEIVSRDAAETLLCS